MLTVDLCYLKMTEGLYWHPKSSIELCFKRNFVLAVQELRDPGRPPEFGPEGALAAERLVSRYVNTWVKDCDWHDRDNGRQATVRLYQDAIALAYEKTDEVFPDCAIRSQVFVVTIDAKWKHYGGLFRDQCSPDEA